MLDIYKNRGGGELLNSSFLRLQIFALSVSSNKISGSYPAGSPLNAGEVVFQRGTTFKT